MDKENMPAADAAHYELAFHVLPTVAEGEVASVVESIKAAITNAGGEITSEEAPQRFDLAYSIVKYLEGRNRKFTSAYFGWVRFTLDPAKMAEVSESVESTSQLLRHLLIRLNKAEEDHVFMFHEALAEQNKSETIDFDEVVEAEETNKETEPEEKGETTEEADDSSDEAKSEVK